MNTVASDRPYALSIAGFDPSGGAGILADIKAFEANGVYGFGVVSSITFQNDISFKGVDWVPYESMLQQISVLLERFQIRFIKVGLIENVEVLKSLLLFLHRQIENPVIILDPVIKASAGYTFHSGGEEQWQEVFPYLTCITPNIPEAKKLFGNDIQPKMKAVSASLAVYCKGGHSVEQDAIDNLYLKQQVYTFSNKRLQKGEKHGSGCVLSAALTAQLALGNDLLAASKKANAYTHKFLASNNTLLGYHSFKQQYVYQ